MSEKLNERNYQLPWKRGIGNDCYKIWDANDRLVCIMESCADSTFLVESINKSVQLETCDLCDESAEYRQCQGCMNDKLIGSHTDEEYEALERQVEGLRKYATHEFRCPVLNTWPQDCTCGLEAFEGGVNEIPEFSPSDEGELMEKQEGH